MSTGVTFDCGICLDNVDQALFPSRSAYATFMPCCNFPIHLRCAKLSFAQVTWSCPGCRNLDSLKTHDGRARFITYLYLRSNFIEGRLDELKSNIRLVKMIFQNHFSNSGESLDEDEVVDCVKPIEGESDAETRERFIIFYNHNVQHNFQLVKRLSDFFGAIFKIVEVSRSDDIATPFRNFEAVAVEIAMPEADEIISLPRSHRIERLIYCLVCTLLSGLIVTVGVISIKEYA